MNPLCILLWKDLMASKRQIISVIFQLVYPLVIALLIFIYIKAVQKQIVEQTPDSIKLQEDKFLDDNTSAPLCILYTPNSNLSRILMEEVGNDLGISPLAAKPQKSPCTGFFPFSNYSEISELVKTFHENEAVVIFKDMDAESWTSRKQDSLTYTIRMKKNFNIHSFMPTGDKLKMDHPVYGDIYDDFMRLQWAIDKSFIRVRTGNRVPQKLYVQEFPHFRDDDAAVLLKIVEMMLFCIFLIYGTMLSSVVLFTQITTRMLRERDNGIQELIKMNGVSQTTIGLAYFIRSLPQALSISLGYSIMLKIFNFLKHTSMIYIFIGLMLYAISLIAFGMACGYVANTARFAVAIPFVIYIATILVLQYVSIWYDGLQSPSSSLTMLCGLHWHLPLIWMFPEILVNDLLKTPLTFGNLNRITQRRGSVMQAYICLIIQSLIYFILTWYLSYVRQGRYGNSLPWNFLCKKKGDKIPITENVEVPKERDNKYFEEPPIGKEVGIKITKVSKYYPKPALENVSLDVYKGEITVLLGHNGAGKTTLMSIITGMIPATQGNVVVNGLEIASHSLEIRKQIGLCTQHNLFFDHISTIEHVMFFSMVKGKSKNCRATSQELLNKLGIGEKASVLPEQLSGGMKRRLQLACALAGDSDVLVLDEPTSGLDVETRRELWNLLLSLRGGHTVLLSTHFMEEADALGDRVAALHSGQLRCHATPMYLKKAMGGGYRLTLITSGKPKEAEISALVKEHVADATIKGELMNTITFNLPSKSTAQFPELFAALETNRSDLGIDSIGVGISTMEEVFLFLCSDSETLMKEESDTEVTASEYGKMKGKVLLQRQAITLFKRQLNFLRDSFTVFIILHLIAPCFLIYLFLPIFNTDKKEEPEPDLRMDLDLYKPLPERRAFMNVNASGASMRAKDEYKGVKFASSRNINDDLYKIGKQNILEFNKYLVGVELGDEHGKALYSTVYRHAAPVALNLLSNIIASQYLPAAGVRAITAYNHPFEEPALTPKPGDAKTVQDCVIWAFIVGLINHFINSNFYVLPAREGRSGARHLHVMAGCPAALHWLCTLAFHTALTLLTVVLMTVTGAYIFDYENTFRNANFLFTLGLILIIGNIAFLGFLYLMHICFEEKVASGLTIASILCSVVISTEKVMSDANDFSMNFAVSTMVILSTILPSFSMMVAMGQAGHVARLNALCKVYKHLCPNLELNERGFEAAKCCAGESKAYISFAKYAPGFQILVMFLQAIVFMTLVILIQLGRMSCFSDRIINKNFKAEPLSHVDELVAAEATHVDQEIKLQEEEILNRGNTLLVSHLHKNYTRLCRKLHAVQGISFSVKKGECFGLLGLNGAGKSTTFKMLTTETCPTAGRIFANGFFLDKQKKKYLRSIGYCPQFLGIDEFQTGSANLRTLLTIRGLDDKDIDKELKAWIAVVGMQKYSDVKPSRYSGGYKRRLAAASALCSGAPLVLLDEPTAGVDVAARRLVHNALRKALDLGDSIVITSHSMDEMEALCKRIAILAAGKIRTIGTPAELRQKYGQGYALNIKIKHYHEDPNKSNGSKMEVDNLKEAVAAEFNCELKDEHSTMLRFYIKDKMNYSEIFSKLEMLREKFPDFIEDYSVNETTLEEVFLHFAKEQLMEKQAAEQAELELKAKKNKPKQGGTSSKV